MISLFHKIQHWIILINLAKINLLTESFEGKKVIVISENALSSSFCNYKEISYLQAKILNFDNFSKLKV